MICKDPSLIMRRVTKVAGTTIHGITSNGFCSHSQQVHHTFLNNYINCHVLQNVNN